MAVAAARAMGAAEVSLEARYPHQIELGERLGATQPTGLYDVVIEAAGSESALHRAAELAAPGGAMGVLGVFRPDVQWPQMLCFMKEVRSVPALGYCKHDGGRDFDDAANLLASTPHLVDALDHAPLPHRGCTRGVPGRRRQVHGRPASRVGAELMSSNVMNHLGQCVTDLERSRTFYEEALGLHLLAHLELDDEPSNQLLRLQTPMGFRACYLKQGPFVLELLHFAGEGAKPAPYRAAHDERDRTHPHLAQRRRHPRPRARSSSSTAARCCTTPSSTAHRSSCATPTASSSSCCRWRTPSASRRRADGARTARPRRDRHRRQPRHREADRARLRPRGRAPRAERAQRRRARRHRAGGRGARRARRAGGRRPVRPGRGAAARRARARRARAHRRARQQHGRRRRPHSAAQAHRRRLAAGLRAQLLLVGAHDGRVPAHDARTRVGPHRARRVDLRRRARPVLRALLGRQGRAAQLLEEPVARVFGAGRALQLRDPRHHHHRGHQRHRRRGRRRAGHHRRRRHGAA